MSIRRLGLFNKPSAGGYLLDTYSNGAAAYSLRKLKTGAIYGIKVRRDSDNATTDVELYSSGSIDLSSTVSVGGDLTTWVGSNSAFVVTWYDQSGNSQDITNATTAEQFRFINTGTLDVKNSKSGLQADTTVRKLLLGAGLTALDDTNSFSVFTVSSSDNLNVNGTILQTRDSSSPSSTMGIFKDGRTQKRLAGIYNVSTYVDLSIQRNVTDQLLIELHSDGTNFYGYDNNAAGSSVNPAGTYANTNFNVGGALYDSGNFLEGYIQEVIIFSAEKTADRAAINSDIDTYYSIP